MAGPFPAGPQHCCCEAARHLGGTWAASAPTARVIDDLLAGEQNATVATSSTHRPADTDSIVAQSRAVSEARPRAASGGYTTDFAKAFKQIPGHPDERKFKRVMQWDPRDRAVVMFESLCELFGGKAGPQNFSRYPAWICYALAVLLALPAQHCVDDLIVQEASDTILSGYECWRACATLMGWDVPDKKSPRPSQCFVALGILVDHSASPFGDVRLHITDKRISQICGLLDYYLMKRQIGPGEAGSLAGKLGFSTGQMFGRFCRAMLRSLYRRQHEARWNLNTQLEATLVWWRSTMVTYVPRSVPIRLSDLPVFVSYSDGEGSEAGVGVALWCPDAPTQPLAGYMRIPREIRLSWLRAKETQSPLSTDIFETEAVGPIVVISEWGHLLRGRLWVHYIDNVGAQCALVKGASSVLSGQIITSYFWERVAEIRTLVWIDRVHTKSNPVDGLSRGSFAGFEKVERVKLPFILIDRIRRQML